MSYKILLVAVLVVAIPFGIAAANLWPMYLFRISLPLGAIAGVVAIWMVVRKRVQGIAKAISLIVGSGLLLMVLSFAPIGWLADTVYLFMAVVGAVLVSVGVLLGTINFLHKWGQPH